MQKVSLAQVICLAELGLGYTLAFCAYQGVFYKHYHWMSGLETKYPAYDIPATISLALFLLGVGLFIDALMRCRKAL